MLARPNRLLWIPSLALALLLLAPDGSAAGPAWPHEDLYSVATPDGRRVVAVGAQGAIRVSRDGGEHWESVASRASESLTSVSMADAEHGWAVGMGGTLLATSDGGAHWVWQSLPKGAEAAHLLGVHALDARRAIAVGTWGTRLRTLDGGQHWLDEPMQIGPDHPRFAWLDAAERASARRGGAVREDVALQSVTCLADAVHCWVVGEFGTALRSDDGGLSWQAGQIDAGLAPRTFHFAPHGSQPTGTSDLTGFVAALAEWPAAVVEIEAFANPRELGDRPTPAALFELLDARLESARARLHAEGVDVSRVRVLSSPPWEQADFGEGQSEGLVAYRAARRAPEPSVRVRLRLRPSLLDVAFRDASNGIAVGLGGGILRSTDGGRSWRPERWGLDTTLYAVGWLEGRALTTGQAGRIWLATRDELGLQVRESGRARGFLRDLGIARPDAATAFAVGSAGQVWRTADAGVRWVRIGLESRHRGSSRHLKPATRSADSMSLLGDPRR